jgi:hypothetical protein
MQQKMMAPNHNYVKVVFFQALDQKPILKNSVPELAKPDLS